METWYVMEDGEPGDPREIEPDAKGVLRHKDGRAVAYAPHGPRSRSVDPKAVAKKPDPEPEKVTREMVAEPEAPAKPRRPYKRRA